MTKRYSMPVISKIFIQNYRSIGPEGIEINLNSNLTALVGRNSTGKSNILRILNTVFGKSYWNSSLFSLDDFHNRNPANDIVIKIKLGSPITHSYKVDGWYDYEFEVHGIQLEFKQYKRATAKAKKGELHLTHCCLDKKGRPIPRMAKAPKRGSRPEFQGPFSVPIAIRDKINVILIPLNRNVFSQSPSDPRTLLGGLIAGARNEFLDKNNTIKLSPEQKSVLGVEASELSSKELFESLIGAANDVLNSGELTKISDTISSLLQENLGESESEGLAFEFEIQSVSDQFKNLRLALTRNELSLPAYQLGSGFQALLVVAIFRAWLSLKKTNAVFLIEEPEIYLHPHARRQFYRVMKEMSDANQQIVYTTHSGDFVKVTDFEYVRRVILEKSQTKILPKDNFPTIDFSQQRLRALELSISGERSDIFFSDKVLLVEGATEKYVFEYVLRNLFGYEPEKHHVAVIEVGGKGELVKYIALAKSLEIEFVAVYDSDILTEKPKEEDKAKRFDALNADASAKNQALESITTAETRHVYSPYLEIELGLTDRVDRKKSSKPELALEHVQSFTDPEQALKNAPTLIAPLKKLLGEKFWTVLKVPETHSTGDKQPTPSASETIGLFDL